MEGEDQVQKSVSDQQEEGTNSSANSCSPPFQEERSEDNKKIGHPNTWIFLHPLPAPRQTTYLKPYQSQEEVPTAHSKEG